MVYNINMKKYSKELKELFNDPNIRRPSSKCKTGSVLGELLMKETSFLVNCLKLSTRLWYVDNDVFEQVKCPNCQKPTNVKIDKNGARIQFCSLKCSSSYINPETGLTIQEQNGIMQSKTKTKKVDGKLSIAQIGAKKSAATMKKVGIDGLSIYEKSAKKQSVTKNKVDDLTGKTMAKIAGEKAKETMSKINPETGLTKFQEIGKKTSKTLIENPNICKERVIKRNETMAEIDKEIGLNLFQIVGIKIKETLFKINP